jgi:uncharacterized Zn finger protein
MSPSERGRGRESRGRGGSSSGERSKGLRLHSRRGRIGRTWWSLRWTAVLESIGLGDRLHRGRSLARAGHVLSLEISPGEVAAEVRGHRDEQHGVRIRMSPIPPATWETLQEILARRALFAARLLAGEMPEPIEEAFSEAGLPLFPNSAEEIEVHCDCIDPASPCPHAAAVFYLMAERFDQDPFQILLFRGQSREDLLAGLKRRWAQSGAKESEIELPPDEAPAEAAASAETAVAAGTGDAGSGFWDLGGDLEAVVPRIQTPAIPEAVLRRLGPPPGAVQDSPAEIALFKAYRIASEWALRLALKDEGHEG